MASAPIFRWRRNARKIDHEIYDLGRRRLQRGATLRNCKLAYKTFGELNAAKDNAIVYPTWYSGQHYDNEWLVGTAWPSIPTSISSSFPTCSATACRRRPATRRSRYNASRFPQVTAYDNVSSSTGW